jgi:hypothetical protein
VNIWVVGYPKSGNTWLARLLGDALNCPIDSRYNDLPHALADEGFDRPNKDITVKQAHLRGVIPDGKAVYIKRDPRDIVVSTMHYWQMGFDEALERVCSFSKRGLPNWLSIWYGKLYKFHAITSYELLHEDTWNVVHGILHALQLEPLQSISEVVRRQEFDRRIEMVHDGRPFGAEIQRRLLRKGRVGDWRDHFYPEAGKRMQDVLGGYLLDNKFVDDENWWKA